MARKRGREEIGGEDRTDKEQCSMYPWDRDQADQEAEMREGLDQSLYWSFPESQDEAERRYQN